MHVRCAISPDPDDLFMFWGLIEGHVDRQGLDWEITTADTHLLNTLASGGGPATGTAPDVSAISIAHYPRVAANYQLFRHGASVGRGYGPALVSMAGKRLASFGGGADWATSCDVESLAPVFRGIRVAVPGLTTTAYMVLRWLVPGLVPVPTPIVPYQLTFDALREGQVEAALLIHEGRLTFQDEGCVGLMDIGVEWHARTGLPLPLGGNVVKRSLGPERIARIDQAISDSIAYALAHRDEAMAWLVQRGVTLANRERLDLYLSMYANQDTLDMGEDGCEGVRRLLAIGAEKGWLEPVQVDFV